MPAMNNILSKWIPVSERSRSLALVYSGMYLGSVTGLAFSPILIHKFGWPSVFYAFGSLGSVWFTLWQSKVSYVLPLLFHSLSVHSTWSGFRRVSGSCGDLLWWKSFWTYFKLMKWCITSAVCTFTNLIYRAKLMMLILRPHNLQCVTPHVHIVWLCTCATCQMNLTKRKRKKDDMYIHIRS